MYEPLNISLASSFSCIPGIGSVWASGTIAKIGDIAAFHSSYALDKYEGLTWKKSNSGDFISEDNHISKAGNTYLHYYLGEAANSVRRHSSEYSEYYLKKYAEATKHQHKRALTLTSRKLVRLVSGLIAKNQLYTGETLDAELHINSNKRLERLLFFHTSIKCILF